MKTISLTRGFVAMVDDEDYERVAQFKWHTRFNKRTDVRYAGRNISHKLTTKHRGELMHRFILGLPTHIPYIDHIDHNGLNNQKSNLRIAVGNKNHANQRKSLRCPRSSHFKGVSRENSRFLTKPWVAWLKCGQQRFFLGRYANEKDAALAYDIAARKHFGEFACTNFNGEDVAC